MAIKDVLHIFHPHFLMNFMLASCFFVLKSTPGICDQLFEDCHLEIQEYEMVTFLGCMIVIKNRKTSNYQSYLSTVFMFAKAISLVMFVRQNPLYGVIYGLLILFHLAFLPEPTYSGPEEVKYFKGPHLDEELENGDKRISWIIEFYAAWAPPCVNFAPVFSELSHKYTLDNFKFGKIDASAYPKVAEKYKIDVSAWSKQLPTLVLFMNGKEKFRRPIVDKKGRAMRFGYSKEQVIKEMQLNEVFNECKKNPLPKKKSKKGLEEKDKTE
ncbi:thioredoxin-related transmembrane protein 2-A-like [Lineus longissimus]|uniref:thioredoxin-related transmembrane protein 2-A-like n=1 Tax=Lineus longissimus TaxID=88925 RepID=UPI002B4EBDF7